MTTTKSYTAKQGATLVLKSYLAVWIFYLTFFTVIGVLSIWFPDLVNNEYKQERLTDMLNNQPFQLIISAVIIAPIYEEMMFRSLIRPSYEDILLFISGWLSFSFMYFSAGITNWYIRFLIMIGLFVAIYYLLQEVVSRKHLSTILRLLNKQVITVLLISSVIFGMAHIYNYVDSFLLNVALFTLIIPRIILGLVAGWLKLKTGVLLWPILLHFVNNAFVIVIMLFLKYVFIT